MATSWRLVNCLSQLRNQMMILYALAKLHTDADAWGTIGDAAHDPTSDHAPHTYAALGSVPVVCADDFPHAPQWGLDMGHVTEQLRLSRDPRIGYVIFNARIFYGRDRNGVAAYTWQPYHGDDLHKTHGHVSSVHTASADDGRAWNLGSVVMAGFTDQQVNDVVWQLTGDATHPPLHVRMNALATTLAAIATQMGHVADLIDLLQGMADNPDTNVTQADVDKIAAAVRQQFADRPLV